MLPCLIPSCAIQRPSKAAARTGPPDQGKVETNIKKDFGFVYGVIPAAGQYVNDALQWGTGVLV